jgi:anti-anti-sigma regulatory factor
MLRVHIEADAKGGTVLRLEGSLSGPWIAELVRAASAASAQRLTIDLAALVYADREGERLLRDLAARAELRGCSPFLAEVLRGG